MDTIVQTIAVHEHALGALNHVRDRLLTKQAKGPADAAAVEELLAANQRAIDAVTSALTAATAARRSEEMRLWPLR